MQCSYSSRLGEFRRCAGVSSQPACRRMKAFILTKRCCDSRDRQMGSPALISYTDVSLAGSPAECALLEDYIFKTLEE